MKCEQLHIYFNKELADIPNVTLASNEGERNHSEHNTTLQNSSNTFHQTDPSNDIVKMSEKYYHVMSNSILFYLLSPH